MDDELEQQSDEAAYLRSYDRYRYALPLFSLDCAVFTAEPGQLYILLGKRARQPQRGKWALPGGFLDLTQDTDLDRAARRISVEKSGCRLSHYEQVATYGDGQRDPRGWSVTSLYMSLIRHQEAPIQPGHSTEAVDWFPVDANGIVEGLEEGDLAFDHSRLIRDARIRMAYKAGYSTLPAFLIQNPFRIRDLKRLFEAVLGRELDNSAFRRRMLESEAIWPTEQIDRSGAHRPAQLYEASDQLIELPYALR